MSLPTWLTPDFTPAIMTLKGMAHDFVGRLPYFLVALVLFAGFYMLAKRSEKLLQLGATRAGRSVNFSLLTARLGRVGLLSLGALVATTIAFPSFTPATLVSLLGLGGVAAGFAFRDILGNLLCGWVLLATEPFRIGDKVVVKGFTGEVENIQTRATTIQTFDGRRVVIPNNIMFNEPVEVATAFEKRRLQVDFPVEREKDLVQAKQKILEAMRGVPLVSNEPEPQVLVWDVNTTHTIFQLRWWILNHEGPSEHLSRDAVLEAVWKAMREVPKTEI